MLDATETGELLPLTGTEYVTGFESQHDTGEPSAPDEAQPTNMQAVSFCFAIDHVDGDHTIDKPAQLRLLARPTSPPFWGDRCCRFRSPHPRTLEIGERTLHPEPGRRPAARSTPTSARAPATATCGRSGASPPGATSRRGAYASDICLVNWPMIDYFEGPVIDVPDAEPHAPGQRAASCRCSVLYWLQTEAPRPTAARAFPACGCAATSPARADGLARRPTSASPGASGPCTRVVEQDLSLAVRGDKGARAATPTRSASACTASTCTPPPAATTTSTSAPARSRSRSARCMPRRVENLLPAGKNIGTTHITNGCYRLHPVEWNVGEVAGVLAAYCLNTRRDAARGAATTPQLLADSRHSSTRDGVRAALARRRGY